MSRVARQAVNEYFDLLLTEESELKHQEIEQDELKKKADVQALLNRSMAQAATLTTAKAQSEQQLKTEENRNPADILPSTAVFDSSLNSLESRIDEKSAESQASQVASWRDALDEPFQCLFFQFAGLTVAVPLHLLGGIREFGTLTKVPGNPDWILGVQPQSEGNVKVVDSQRWLMPDRPAADVNYRYLVQLGDSDWAFACEALVDAEPLRQSEVKWRQAGTNQRRHLAGIVRERMCVVLDVSETIALLDAGMNITLKES